MALTAISKKQASREVEKQDCFIQIGKHRHRIANDHHAALSDLRASFFRYAPMDEVLFMTSLIGASLLLNLPLLPLINVRNRAEGR